MSTTVPGNLHVANDVLADMVGNAALECYGVVGMTAPTAVDGIAKILPASRLRRGVVVTTTEKGVHVELYVVIEYGTNITTVSQNLVDQVQLRADRVRARAARRRRGARPRHQGAQVAPPEYERRARAAFAGTGREGARRKLEGD